MTIQNNIAVILINIPGLILFYVKTNYFKLNKKIFHFSFFTVFYYL